MIIGNQIQILSRFYDITCNEEVSGRILTREFNQKSNHKLKAPLTSAGNQCWGKDIKYMHLVHERAVGNSEMVHKYFYNPSLGRHLLKLLQTIFFNSLFVNLKHTSVIFFSFFFIQDVKVMNANLVTLFVTTTGNMRSFVFKLGGSYFHEKSYTHDTNDQTCLFYCPIRNAV